MSCLGSVAAAYPHHPKPKRVGPDGRPCHRQTAGLLRRRPLRAAGTVCIGKEAHRLEDRGLVADLDELLSATPTRGGTRGRPTCCPSCGRWRPSRAGRRSCARRRGSCRRYAVACWAKVRAVRRVACRSGASAAVLLAYLPGTGEVRATKDDAHDWVLPGRIAPACGSSPESTWSTPMTIAPLLIRLTAEMRQRVFACTSRCGIVWMNVKHSGEVR